MALWGSADQANNAPKVVAVSTPTTSTPVYANTAYANATIGAFVSGARIGVFGANTTEAASVGKGVSPGWVKKTEFTGPVTSFTVVTPGSGYSNTNLVRLSGGQSNAVGQITTFANGSINTVTVTTPGAGFVNVSNSTVAYTNATGGATGVGTGANVVPVLGGRAGRVQYENLVALGNMTGTGSTLT